MACFISSLVLLLRSIFTISVPQIVEAQALGRTSTSNGKDFYIGFMQNLGGTEFTSLRLLLSTAADEAMFVVETRSETIQQGTVTSGSSISIEIDHSFQVAQSDFRDREKGIHVYTTNNESILVIAENFVSPFNYGVFLAYPCLIFETESGYEYYIISTEASDNFRSQVLIVGCENDTLISIIPSQSVSLPTDIHSQTESATISVDPGASHNGTFNQMQTLLLISTEDLTGTRIISNKPLTVIAGHECASVPLSATGCEPFAIQVPPAITWGSSFLLASFAGRETQSAYKLVVTEETTFVVTCGDNSQGSTVTDSFQFSSDMFCFLHSSNPILLVQKATGGSIDGIGDPAIALVSPIDQYINNVAFLSLPFESNYISVTVSAEHFNASSILFNGEVINCEWIPIFNNSNSEVPEGYGCNTTVVCGSDMPTQHVVSHSDPDGRLSVLVYGFTVDEGYGYAYLAGQDISVTTDDSGDVVFTTPGSVPYFSIDGAPGVIDLGRVSDTSSGPIYIPNGLIFGNHLFTAAFVNENGVISFNEPWMFSYPNDFPTRSIWTRQRNVIAPFWSDNDIRLEGVVRYTSYCNISNHPECNHNTDTYQPLLDVVNRYIQNDVVAEGNFFVGNWMLIAQWDHVHPSPHGNETQNMGFSNLELNKTNTYQAVVVTNITHSFALFTYICGEIQWSTSGTKQEAVIGYNSEGQFFFNYRLSGYPSVGNDVSCSTSSVKRRKRQSSNENTAGFEMPTQMELQNLFDLCTKIYKKDVLEYTGSSPSASADMLEPCPPTRSQADEDGARFRLQIDRPDCYVSMKPVTQRLSTVGPISPTQQCCFNSDGALITSGVGAGTLLIQHPLRDPDGYIENNAADSTFGDKTFRDTCCDERLNGTQCNQFMNRRPSDNSSGYTPPSIGIGWGDPHYTTFDGLFYDFQGQGDFHLLQVIPEGHDDSIFSIQGRLSTEPFESESVGWTLHVGLAFGASDNAFEVGKAPGFRLIQTRPGTFAMEINVTSHNSIWKSPNGDVEIQYTQPQNNQPVILNAYFFNTGIHLLVRRYPLNNWIPGLDPLLYDWINFEVRVPCSYSMRTFGLLGNLDGDSTNDLYRRGNTIPLNFPGSLTEEQLREILQDSWIVQQGESLFSVPARRRRRQASEFQPVFFENLNFTDEQRLICDNNRQCLFDLVASGQLDLAMTTLDHEKQANMTNELLNNFPPIITSENTSYKAILGQELVIYLNVEDSADNFTVVVQGGLPDNSVLEKLSEGKYVFQWTMNKIVAEPLKFLANDSKGAASILAVTLEICACANGGNCTLDGLLSSNNEVIILNCLCMKAFSGTFCEEDRNGCSEIQCFEGVECMDVPAPGVGAVCGDCPPGYTGDSLKCYDIDECFLDATLCEQVCTNTDGGFVCSCMEGYQLLDGNQCEDIDECTTINNCQQVCTNTEGSYSCSCSEGFTLATDDRNCTADVSCDGACSFACAVIDEQELCYCPAGFHLEEVTRTQCNDRDECLIESNPCEHVCTNNEGSFSCSCRTGYQLLNNGKTCEDINECFQAALILTDLCENDPNSQCINTEGSFTCTCAPGYTLQNESCQRTSECFLDATLCEQVCTDTDRGFVCSCMEGYQLLDGNQCEDTDECIQAAHILIDLCESEPNSQCINTEGSFTCTCAPGYVLQNESCIILIRNEPKPNVDVIIVDSQATLTPDTFTPNRQEIFKTTTAVAVNNYCKSISCKLILPSGEVQRITQLVISSANVAIPTSLIKQNNGGYLEFVVYVQVNGTTYLLKDHLKSAIMNAVELYKMNGFSPTLEAALPPTVLNSAAGLIGVIVGAVITPVILAAVIILTVMCCKHKKNKKKNLFEMDDVKVVVNPLYEDITIVAKLRN